MKSFLKVWLSISFIAIGVGIGLLVIAAASGASFDDMDIVSMNETYDGIENIDFDISYNEVSIIKGDTFSIKAEGVLEDEFDSYVTDGTWYIKENENSYFEMFGFEFPTRHIISLGDHFTPHVTITIPEGFKADRFSLSVAAGTVTMEEVNAATGDFDIKAGSIHVEQLKIDGDSEYAIGAGEMVINDSILNNVTVDCGAGQIDMNGAITGNNKFKSGIGDIHLKIDGAKDDYSYEITCGIGDVDIDGTSYDGINHEIMNEDAAENSLTLDCGVGNISVEFNN